jgi:phosphoglycolate phosphatase-like HAD superfamily hydrolase
VVSLRLKKLATGELTVEDCTIKGSVDLIRALKERGITLYLASGTDIDDVVYEAELLGYADLFKGGIHGSVGDISKYSKKKVIHEIIAEHHLAGNELAVFGDGPVEIKECIKSNGIAIGIASDEVRRSGLNQEKRTRLIRSGAQILVPDFSQTNRLLGLLFNL